MPFLEDTAALLKIEIASDAGDVRSSFITAFAAEVEAFPAAMAKALDVWGKPA